MRAYGMYMNRSSGRCVEILPKILHFFFLKMTSMCVRPCVCCTQCMFSSRYFQIISDSSWETALLAPSILPVSS